MPKKKSKLDKIYEEVAYNTNEKPTLVKGVIKDAFVEIGLFLLTKNAPVMIRRFVKIVKAIRTTKQNTKNYKDYETRKN